MKITRSGTYGWIALAGLVLAFDVIAGLEGGETMSTAYRRGLRRSFWATTGLTIVVVLHLHDHLPDKADPFHHVASAVRFALPLK